MLDEMNEQMDEMIIDEEAPRVTLKSKNGVKIPVKLIDAKKEKEPMMNA